MKTVVNFGAGPAKLPVEVLEKAQREFLDYNGLGISVLEMSHRSSDFGNLIKETEKLVRDLLVVPDEYAVLFMHGGGTGQFAAIPQNLGFLSKASPPSADYVVTGSWSDKAIKEADKFIKTNKVFKIEKPYSKIPAMDQWSLSEDAAYLYYCANETIHGVEFHDTPQIDWTKIPLHALAYAGTQKNIGAGGLTLVVVRKDLLGKAHPQTPSILNYEEIHNNKSIYNTPPCFNIYITKLVLEWIRDQGGAQTIFERNQLKAEKFTE
uniref:Aminotransferase class V domain-containing protein n=1 Tax=Ditylenchus dipsaci TaxID=166011 RepID=A0A915EQX8_9BILA